MHLDSTTKFDNLVTPPNTKVRPKPLTNEEFSVILLEEELQLGTHDGNNDTMFSATCNNKGGGSVVPLGLDIDSHVLDFKLEGEKIVRHVLQACTVLK